MRAPRAGAEAAARTAPPTNWAHAADLTLPFFLAPLVYPLCSATPSGSGVLIGNLDATADAEVLTASEVFSIAWVNEAAARGEPDANAVTFMTAEGEYLCAKRPDILLNGNNGRLTFLKECDSLLAARTFDLAVTTAGVPQAPIRGGARTSRVRGGITLRSRLDEANRLVTLSPNGSAGAYKSGAPGSNEILRVVAVTSLYRVREQDVFVIDPAL